MYSYGDADPIGWADPTGKSIIGVALKFIRITVKARFAIWGALAPIRCIGGLIYLLLQAADGTLNPSSFRAAWLTVSVSAACFFAYPPF
jgi:hypothetical protein